jgi:ABC-2 type transport system permease protein
MIWTIAKKELRGYFGSAVALIFLGAFLAGALYTVFWHEKFFARGLADLRPLFEWMPILLAFLIAALSMRLWAEERNTGTLEVLLTLPVARWKLVAGKFIGGMLLIAIALALTLGIPLTVAQMGDLDVGPVIGGYLAALLLSAAYLVVGMCISAATNNQIVAVVGTAVTFGIMAGVGKLGELGRLFGTSARFESVARGVLDLRDLAFYAGIVAIGFAVNVLLIGSVSWGQAQRARARRFQTVLSVGLIAINAIVLVIWLAPVRGARVDLTQDGAYSLSSATRNVLAGIDERVLIRGYFSEKTHPQLAPLIPQLRDLLEEYRAAGGDRVKVEIVDPTEDDDAKRDAKERFDIVPQPMAFATASERSVVNSYFSVAIEYGDQHEVLGLFDLIQVRQLDVGEVEISLRNVEYQITKSIKKTVQSFSSLDALFASTPGKIKLTAYVTPDTLPDNLKDAPAKLKKATDELIKESNGKLEVTQVSPKTEAEMLDLYRKYGIRPFTDLASGKTYYFQLLLEISDRLVRIQPPDTLGEAAIKAALLDGLKRGAPGFTRVVGLWAPRAPINPQEMTHPGMPRTPPPQTFEKLKAALAGDYEVRDLLLDSKVPEDIDVLILAGPASLDAKAVANVEQFAMRGGSLIVLNGRFRLAPAEGIAIERVTTGLEKLFEGWGITVGDQLVLDTRSDTFPIPRNRDLGNGMIVREVEQLPYPYFVKIAGSQIESSLITAGIPGSVMHFASPVTVKDKPGRVNVEPLLTSSDQAWLSSSLSIEPDATRRFPGPTDGKRDSHPLAVAVTFTSDETATKATLDDKLPADARIAVFGSSVFVTDTLLGHAEQFDQELALSNVNLIHNAVDWAFADTDLLGIRSQAIGAHSLTIDPDETMKWKLINVALALGGLAAVIAIPLVRRRAVVPVVRKEAR